MTQGPVSSDGLDPSTIGEPVDRRHSAPSKSIQAGWSNLSFSTAIRIWEQLQSDGGVDPECELQAVDVAVITDAWICAVNEERAAEGRSKLQMEDKKALSACMNIVVHDIGVDCYGQIDACEWLFQALVRFSSPAIGWSITQLSGLMRMALDRNLEFFDNVRNLLKATESKNGGPLRFKDLILTSCILIWKELEDQGILDIFAKRRKEPAPWQRISRNEVRLEEALQLRADSFANEVIRVTHLEPNRNLSVPGFMVCCLGRPRREVSLHQYDLTRGGAKVMSFKHLEGVWHTGLVIYGREYFFNGELVFKDPGETSFGTPTKVCHLGYSFRRKEELHSWVVEELKPVFTRAKYDIIDNNCNHFTNQMAQWLCGNPLPDEVIGQADAIKNNPVLAQMLKPVFRVAEVCCCNSTSTSTSNFTVNQLTWTSETVREGSEELPTGAVYNGIESKLSATKFAFKQLFNRGYSRNRPKIIKVSL